MTVEKLRTAIANIEAYLSESPGDDDTVTLTANVIRSIKENYEELIEAKAEIERLQRNLEEAFAEIEEIKTLQTERVNEFAKRLKAVSHPYADTQMVFELQIDNLVKEMVGEG